MRNLGPRLLLTLALSGAAGCNPPVLTSIDPGTGYPRQLLAVNGSTFLASVVWDVGLATETVLTNGFLGTNYFQVPAGASAGVHPVALRNSVGTSGSVDVTVLAPSGTFPAPRIEDVGLRWFEGAGPVGIALVVTAANMDVDATMTVDGAAPSLVVRWGGLPIDYQQAHTPATFGYPVYHYVQLLGIVDTVALGAALDIIVTNTDGLADTVTYTLPASADSLDSDGDGLMDTWEEGVYVAANGDTIPLQSMGTGRWRKDIPVEVDWIAAAAPDPSVWGTIDSVFLNAPVLNPDGTAGIDLIIDRGQGAPFTGGGTVLADHTTMDFGANAAAGYADFFTYKAASFDSARLEIFRYGIFGRARPSGSSGRGEVWGNDFMVTFVNFVEWGLPLAQVGTFVHEFGHTLGLSHGDLLTTPAQWNEQYKPNFPTTMNYRWQFPGASLDCDWVTEAIHTYSQGTFARIVENNVDENIGICDNASLDMDGDGVLTIGAVDTSLDGTATDTHDDFDQWSALRPLFRTGGSNWLSN